MMTMFESIDFIPILQIIWIDLLLSADNAVVIALACRGLPEKQKRIGLIFGVSTAIILRILFASIITLILDMPFIRTVGGILLIWIAIKLILPEDESHEDAGDSDLRELSPLLQALPRPSYQIT